VIVHHHIHVCILQRNVRRFIIQLLSFDEEWMSGDNSKGD
jgi:hypothetical protein